MAWPTYTITDLALYTGRNEASFTEYSTTAIAQSLLLFKIYTCLVDWPSDATDAELAKYAVLSMADAFALSQPHAEVLGGPFQSETIGSYSYSKAQKQLTAGLPTGLSWFDLAVQRLGVCASGVDGGTEYGSIGVFEDEGLFYQDADGKSHLLGPSDLDTTTEQVLSSDRGTVQP